jgi:ABC-type uncharacterized transport system auxiliary subunit
MRRALLLVAVALATLAGCSQPRVPEDNFYRLTIAPPRHMDTPLIPGIVEVSRFVADGLVSQRAIVYSQAAEANVAQAYHYDLWIEPPTSLLQNALVDYLRAAGAAGTVVTPELRAEPDAILSGHIRRFEHVRGGAGGSVRVSLDLSLRERKSDKLLLVKSYEAERPVGDSQLQTVAREMSAAVEDIYGRLLRDLAVAAK